MVRSHRSGRLSATSAPGLMAGLRPAAYCVRVSLRRLAHPVAVDRLVAVLLTVVALAQVLVFLPIAPLPVGALVALGTAVPIAWRHTHPVIAALVGSAVWLI